MAPGAGERRPTNAPPSRPLSVHGPQAQHTTWATSTTHDTEACHISTSHMLMQSERLGHVWPSRGRPAPAHCAHHLHAPRPMSGRLALSDTPPLLLARHLGIAHTRAQASVGETKLRPRERAPLGRRRMLTHVVQSSTCCPTYPASQLQGAPAMSIHMTRLMVDPCTAGPAHPARSITVAGASAGDRPRCG